MKINNLVGNIFHANCYILNFDKYALVIDPCVSYDDIKALTGDLEIKAILLTHGHADHFIYLEDIKNKTNAKIYCHKNAKEKIEDENKNYSVLANYQLRYFFDESDYVFVHEGSFSIEDTKIKVIETPGHCNCSVVYIIEDNIFSGDTLFYKTIGRTDLYTSSTLKMNESLRKLMRLDESLIIHPGHGKETTLGFELKNNPYLKKLS